ncbi:acyl carrier protein [Paenibacillus solani]|uniref:acyl carrier protein n=1 Tax=Paenibacillus solani TaxID=1705565 RepID=UPI003D2D7F41
MKIGEFVKEFEEILTLEAGTITLDSKLNDIDEWDSLTKIALSVFLEDEFNIHLEQRELDSLESLGDIVEKVKSQLEYDEA